MTCLSLKDAKKMAAVLGKDGVNIEIFVMATGQTVANETAQAEEARLPGTGHSASESPSAVSLYPSDRIR
jgi:hypothetical protein